MADTQSKELKVREKQEVTSLAEQTTPGLVFTPAVDIFETEKDITLLADMPGVKSDDLTILVEYETGRYYRQFTLGELINQENIDAKLNDGVLRLTLPKVEKATPKKITVQTG
jgi:HSP20 family molecular chaperone IbpA